METLILPWRVILAFLSIFVTFSYVGAILVEESDASALLSLKAASDDPNNIFASWQMANDCSTWYGVNCNAEGRVSSCVIFGNSLSGVIPGAFFNLPFLTFMSLSGNNFSGPLPSSISNLKSVTFLYLFANRFNGSIPASITNLTTLAVMELQGNSFTGPVPSNVADMKNLKSINLSGNNLSGILPATLGMSSPNLLSIDFSYNSLSGTIPSSILGATNMTALKLQGNLLTGPIPSFLSSLRRLQFLDLSENRMEGAIPLTYGTMTSLESLTLAGNSITGNLPFNFFENLTALQTLNISMSSISGDIPSLSNLFKLEVLDLRDNYFNTFPNDIGSLSNLNHLDLSDNILRDLPSDLSKLTSLTYLNLSGNVLRELPAGTGRLTLLQTLDLSGNLFSAFPADLGSLVELQVLNLANNSATEAIPAYISRFTKLTQLDLSGNRFTSSDFSLEGLKSLQSLDVSRNLLPVLPDGLFNSSSLQSLNLAGNMFSGNVPATFNVLTNLRVLQLQKNGFTGQLPDFSALVSLTQLDVSNNLLEVGAVMLSNEAYFSQFPNLVYLGLDDVTFGTSFLSGLASLTNLQTLRCSRCSMNGTLPDFTPLMKLQNLILANNQFQGTLPESMCSLNALSTLDLSQNSLEGTIPDCFGNLTALNNLWLYGNSLTGSIPSTLKNLSCLSSLLLHENSLMGAIPELHPNVSCASGIELEYLDVSNNNLTGGIPSSLGLLTSLKILSLASNEFEGSIPLTLGNITSLETLRLSSSGLQGPIPSTLGKLTSLRILDLSNNEINGSYSPEFFDSFRLLRILVMSRTSISGVIPLFTNLSSLTSLDMSSNMFSSSLQPPYPNSLVSLDFSNNGLSGNITTAFDGLQQLSIILLDNNSFSGAVPSLAASLVSLQNNAFDSLSIPTTNSSSASQILRLQGNPVCSSSSLLSSCQSSSSSSFDYTAPSVCSTQCQQSNSPNPYLFGAQGVCQCSGFVRVQLTLWYSPFLVFTASAAEQMQQSVADLLSLNDQQVLLVSAVRQSDGSIATSLQLYDVAPGGVPSSVILSRLTSLWVGPDGRVFYPGLEIADVGIALFPSSVATVPYYVPKSSSELESWVIAVIVVAAVLLLAAGLVAGLLYYRRKSALERQSSFTVRLQSHFVRALPLAEIRAATDNFSERHLLGSGGYGNVYMGQAANGELWAVKRAKSVSLKSLREFENEVDVISKISHTNIVKLLGYCDQKNEQILVYEYMKGGTLKQVLHGATKEMRTARSAARRGRSGSRGGVTPRSVGSSGEMLAQGTTNSSNGYSSGNGSVGPNHEAADLDASNHVPLTFEQRLDIAIGAAEGLRYLHKFANPTIIHRDVKSENILLDEKMQAKIADFGLLKDSQKDGNQDLGQTRVAGTPGYLDPEYYNNFRVTAKSDVYSFGVVLFELITGKGPLIAEESVTDPDEEDDSHMVTSLVSWAQPYLNDLDQLVDPDLKANSHEDGIKMMIQVAVACTGRSTKYRPGMDEVTHRLVEIKNLVSGTSDNLYEDDGGEDKIGVMPQLSSNAYSSASESQSMFVAPVSVEYKPR